MAVGPSFKGGATRYEHVLGDLKRLLHDSSAIVVTTLFDYYALPASFPGMSTRPPGSALLRVGHVEATWAEAIADRRFVPHLALHELEAWIFAAPTALEPWMFDDDADIVAAIAEVAAKHATPEDINEGVETAPSKRLERAFQPNQYQKTLHGLLALQAIGIDRIRATCPHFAAWLHRLEAVAAG
jgi:hypothetical protein